MDIEKLPRSKKFPVHELSKTGSLVLRPEFTLRYHTCPLRTAYIRQLKHTFLQEFNHKMQKLFENCIVLYC